MSSQAQIKANRQNAQKSTGPKTAEGKTTVSQNALKHGLFAAQDVLSVENQDEYDLLREEMLAELAPVGAVESLLAQRAVSLAWRLRRAERMQDEVVQDMIEGNIDELKKNWGYSRDDPRQAGDYLVLGRIAKRDWSDSRVLERMLMYERRIEWSLYRTIAKLRAVQLMRELSGGDASKAQQSAQEQNDIDLKKQSQSAELSEVSAPLPPSLIDYLQTAYGDNPPQWVRTRLRQAGHPFKGGNGSKRASARKTRSQGGKTPFPLNLLNL
jgi:hypothetical protein